MATKYHKFLHDAGVDLDPVFERKLQDLFRKVSTYLNRRDLDFEVHVGESGNPHGQVAWTSGFRMAIHLKSTIPVNHGDIFLDENTPMEYYAFLMLHEYGHTHYAPENEIIGWATFKMLERDGHTIDWGKVANATNLITDIIINISILQMTDLQDRIGLDSVAVFKSKFKIEMNKDIARDTDSWIFYQWQKWFFDGKVNNAPQPEVVPLIEKLFINRKKPVHAWKDEFYVLYKELVLKWRVR